MQLVRYNTYPFGGAPTVVVYIKWQ